MQQSANKFGIYLNVKENQVVRINSPYWIPEAPDWVFVTSDVNSTLLHIRSLVKQGSLCDTPDSIVWGNVPLKD